MKPNSKPALFSVLVLGALLGGCTTPSSPGPSHASVPPPAAPVEPAATVATEPPAAVATESIAPVPAPPENVSLVDSPTPPSPELLSSLAPEVAALVVNLTDSAERDTLAHDIVDTTGFPEAIASLAPGAAAPKVEKIASQSQPPARGLTAEGDSVDLVERDWTGLVLIPINKSLSKAYTSAVRLLKVEAHPLQDGRVRVWIRMKNRGNTQLPSEVACAFTMRSDTKPISPNFYELMVPGSEYRDVFFVSPPGELTTYTVLVRSNRINYRVSQR